jgi:F-type H+-transporting ATPase subunit epsilon
MELFKLSILTPLSLFFEDQIISVIVPGKEGFFEVLAHHAPLVALIKPGKLTITTKENKKLVYAVSSGFFEVSNNHADMVVDAIENVSGIDVLRAKKAFARAKERLEITEDHVDSERAKRALLRAKNRIELHDHPDGE